MFDAKISGNTFTSVEIRWLVIWYYSTIIMRANNELNPLKPRFIKSI